jgi:hypothetical protein
MSLILWLFESMMPCSGMSDRVMVLHIITSGISTVLVCFLTQRRVRKDAKDDARWATNEQQHSTVYNEVRRGMRDSGEEK